MSSCGLLSSSPTGWWIVQSITKDGETLNLTDSESYMVGFNSVAQLYSLSASDPCNGVEQDYEATSGKITVSAASKCPAWSTSYSRSGNTLTLTKGKLSGELVFDKVVLKSISQKDVSYYLLMIPISSSTSGSGSSGSKGTDPASNVKGTSFDMAQINGFWRFTAMSYQGTTYYPGERIANFPQSVLETVLINYFQDGKFIQFTDDTASTVGFLNFSIKDGFVVCPEQMVGTTAKFQGFSVAVTSVDSTQIWTGPFLYRYNGDSIRERYKKLTLSEAESILHDNAIYKKLFP